MDSRFIFLTFKIYLQLIGHNSVQMVRFIILCIGFFALHTPNALFGQHAKFGFQQLLDKSPLSISTFCVPNDSITKALLDKDGIKIKYHSGNYLFISAPANWIHEKTKSNELENFYFEYAPPMALADTTRVMHFVNQVHQGSNGLSSPYLGENIIIGYVDQGIDWNHPDFKEENGETRVLRYWDQTTNAGGTIPQPYNYGIVWDNNAINNGSCTSLETSTAHGSTVAGMGSGNGMANGTNTGIAPKSKIIVVESNFDLPNWTLTIADACDYIFKVADSLGMPAVINLSLGTYLGSHDGNDPAAEYMEDLVTEKAGRIIVCAAGNSGAKGKYHVTGNVDSDTSFVWLLNNPSSSAAFGANKVFFDLWSDGSDATYNFALGADLPAPTYGLRGKTIFRPAQSNLNTLIYDTIYSTLGYRIATLEIYTELENGNYHLQVLFSSIDSTSYLFRFMTTGSGKYDLWSGAWLGLNDLVTTLPTVSVLPEIMHYHQPDLSQSVVSSWNCSEKIISVGNFRNRLGHIDNNGNQYYPSSDMTNPGKLSPNSSKGPNRHGVIKPDISAAGDVSLSAGPLNYLNNPINNAAIDSGGWHVRNGGTSMASPVISGIAALFLEKCSKANYAYFKTQLLTTAFSDGYTSSVPNNSYGFGKANALNLILQNEFNTSIIGNGAFCAEPIPLTAISASPIMSVNWSNGFVGTTNYVPTVGEYSATVYNTNGCSSITDTFTVFQTNPLPMLPIIQTGNTLATLSFTTYQWTLNGQDIPGATSSTLEIFPPYGTYTCYSFSDVGCISVTAPFTVTAGMDLQKVNEIMVSPNPTNDQFSILSDHQIEKIQLFSVLGQEILPEIIGKNSYSISSLPQGVYHLIVYINKEKFHTKIIRM